MSNEWRGFAILACLLLLCHTGSAGKCLTITGQDDITQGPCSGVSLNGRGVCVSSGLSEAAQQSKLQEITTEWVTWLSDLTDQKCVDLFNDEYCELAAILGITDTKLTTCQGDDGCPLIMRWGLETGCTTDAQCGDYGANESTPNPCCTGLADAFLQMCEGADLELVASVYPTLKLTLINEPPREDRYFCRDQPECVNAAPIPTWPCEVCEEDAWDDALLAVTNALDEAETLTQAQCDAFTAAIDAFTGCMKGRDDAEGGSLCCEKYAAEVAKEPVTRIQEICPSSSYVLPTTGCSNPSNPGTSGQSAIAVAWALVAAALAAAGAHLLR